MLLKIYDKICCSINYILYYVYYNLMVKFLLNEYILNIVTKDTVPYEDLIMKIVDKMGTLNNNIQHLVDFENIRIIENEKLKQVLKDVTNMVASVHEAYENVPILLEGISRMFTENSMNQDDISSILTTITDTNKTIKHNMKSTEAGFLSLAQEEFIKAVSEIISHACQIPSSQVFNSIINWFIKIQINDHISIRKEMREMEKRIELWMMLIKWSTEEFSLNLITISTIHAMFTVFFSETTGKNIMETELMITLLKLHDHAISTYIEE